MNRNKVLTIIFTLLLGALLLPGIVRACEPCAYILNFEETVAEADLIMVGRKTADGPSTGNGPDWISVQVVEVLLGNVAGGSIRVNSWDGMCAYGIIIEDDGLYVMLLKEGEDMYRAIEWGCSVKQFPVMDEYVQMDDGSVHLDDFVQMLGPDAARPVLPRVTPARRISPQRRRCPRAYAGGRSSPASAGPAGPPVATLPGDSGHPRVSAVM